jgi:ABC-type Zn uptake system ZnuABC Zn-binding protein ZnuA
MALNKEQEEIYKKAMDEAKKELDSVDSNMQEEIQKARQKLAELQESKKHFRQIYEGTALLLGIEVEPEEESDPSQAKQPTDENEGTEAEDGSDKTETSQAQTA